MNKKIVITGPESSGKTTISNQLARYLNACHIREYAREYLEIKGGSYTFEDVINMAMGQFEKELIAQDRCKVIVSDTDLLTYEIWIAFKYQKSVEQIKKLRLQLELPDLYFLCYPDFEWEYDPLRENPSDRETLFDLYLKKLIELDVKYIILKGSAFQRINMALNHIQSL